MRCYVIMGVSGCGKSSVGTALAVTCRMDFIDGDDLHPPQNIDKMACERPLNDKDRAPWLVDVGKYLASTDEPIVIGCSALKKKYRDWIRREVPEPVRFIHLGGSKDILAERVRKRSDHFMSTSLLDSQYNALEPLSDEELGIEIDISVDFLKVIAQAETYVQETMI
ncbi:MAG: gluconokinase [Roseobacter sp.]